MLKYINEIIEKYSHNASFVEIGGLWGTVNERITIAAMAGATSLTMVDMADKDGDLWVKFRERCRSFGVENYVEIVHDAASGNLSDVIGKKDYLHCAGVIYHIPNPISFIVNCTSCFTKYMSIGSAVVPEEIEIHGVTLRSSAYCIPCLSMEERNLIKEWLIAAKYPNPAGIVGENVEWWVADGRYNYAPWWYLFTPSYLTQLLEKCGLRIVESGQCSHMGWIWVCEKARASA